MAYQEKSACVLTRGLLGKEKGTSKYLLFFGAVLLLFPYCT